MKTKYFLVVPALIVFQLSCKSQVNKNINDSLVITILYEDKSINDSILPGYGFSALIENGKEVCLFDVGKKPDILIHNMDQLGGIDYSKINYVFISHIHDDHMGGLHGVLDKLNKPALYMPYSYPKLINEPTGDRADSDWQALLDSYEPKVSGLIQNQEPINIGDIGYSTGVIESVFYEQSLIIPTSNGLVILAGCSHHGILELVKQAKSLCKQDIYFIMGGFHLTSTDSKQVITIAQELKNFTKYIGPCHCTGDNAQQIFKEVFNENYIDVKTGTKLKLSDGGISK